MNKAIIPNIDLKESETSPIWSVWVDRDIPKYESTGSAIKTKKVMATRISAKRCAGFLKLKSM